MTRPLKFPGFLYDACHYFMPRLLFLHTSYGPQVQWGDIAQALHDFPESCCDLASAEFWEEWMQRWKAHGEYCLEQAELSLPGPGRARGYRTASASFHWAEFMYFSDPTTKTALRRKSRDCFLKALDNHGPKILIGQIPWQGTEITYYLLLPDSTRHEGERPPCVILSNGLDSVTELEPFAFAEQFLERGMAALLFEGPGQGIHVGCTPLDVRIELIVPELIARLSEDGLVDCERLGFFGVSFGGYLALRAAHCVGKQFKGIVNLSGGPALAPYAGLPRRLKEDFEFAFMPNNGVTMQDHFDAMHLQPTAPCETDVLSIHGALDDIFPVGAVTALDEVWGGRHSTLIYPRAAHVCLNHIGQYSVTLTDWLAMRLLK